MVIHENLLFFPFAYFITMLMSHYMSQGSWKITPLWIWKPIRGKVVHNKIFIPSIDWN